MIEGNFNGQKISYMADRSNLEVGPDQLVCETRGKRTETRGTRRSKELSTERTSKEEKKVKVQQVSSMS